MSMRRTPDSRVSWQHLAYPSFTGSNPSDYDSDKSFGAASAFSAPPPVAELKLGIFNLGWLAKGIHKILGGLVQNIKGFSKFCGGLQHALAYLSVRPFPPLRKGNSKVSAFCHAEDGGSGTSSFKPMDFSAAKHRYKNELQNCWGFENQPLQEVENYAVYKAEETTRNLNDFLKIAEETREHAAGILVTLHQQGEQTNRTLLTAASMNHDLSLGEKLLGSLGGLFSKTWKPVRSRQIKGPSIVRDESFMRRGDPIVQRQRLGLSAPSKVQFNSRQHPSQPTTTLEKIKFDKSKQGDTLSLISDVLGELKEEALEIGHEIDRRNKLLDHLQDLHARRLLGR